MDEDDFSKLRDFYVDIRSGIDVEAPIDGSYYVAVQRLSDFPDEERKPWQHLLDDLDKDELWFTTSTYNNKAWNYDLFAKITEAFARGGEFDVITGVVYRGQKKYGPDIETHDILLPKNPSLYPYPAFYKVEVYKRFCDDPEFMADLAEVDRSLLD